MSLALLRPAAQAYQRSTPSSAGSPMIAAAAIKA
jgi:hypothetical protein